MLLKKKWKACRGEREAQCVARRALEWVWEAPAPSPGFQLLPLGSMTFSFQERWNLKDGVTDYKQCSYQGLADTEVSDFIRDLPKMLPDQYQKYINWDQTRTAQGTWPTKTVVNMWFRNETHIPMMIGMLDILKKRMQEGAL